MASTNGTLTPNGQTPAPPAARSGGLTGLHADIAAGRNASPYPDLAGESDHQRPAPDILPGLDLTADGRAPQWVVNHIYTFSGIYGGTAKAYRHRADEATRHSLENARAMRRDTFISAIMQERTLATQQLNWSIEPDSPLDPVQKQVAAGLTKLVEAIPNLQDLFGAALEAIWLGRAGSQLLWEWVPTGQTRQLKIIDHFPVHGDKFVFQHNGDTGLLVHRLSGLPQGAPTVVGERGRVLLLNSPFWRERFLIHHHQKLDADYYEPDLAGQRFGVGVRSFVYWYWWLREEVTAWIIDHAERIGQGLTIYYYEAGNDESKEKAEEAAREQSRNTYIVWPRPIGQEKQGAGVEHIDIGTTASEFLLKLVKEYFEAPINRYIIGQELSSQAEGTGLGSSTADLHASCVPLDSEILTKEGFKEPHDVQVGELVLAYDAETDSCRWTPLEAKSFFNDRPVSRLYVEGFKLFDAICTSDHSWAVEKTKYLSDFRGKLTGETELGLRGSPKPKNQKRYLKKAEEITSRENIIMAAPERDTVESLLTPTEAAILGWAVTDGVVRWVGNYVKVGICQSKLENIEEIRELVASRDAYEWKGKPTTRTFPTGQTYDCLPQHWWYLPVAAGRELVEKCGFKGRDDLPRIVTQLNSAARQAMLQAMLKAEGTDHGDFINTDPRIIEAFEILCALEGRATGPLLRKKSPAGYKQCYTKKLKKPRLVHGSTLKMEDAGRTDVWCPTTKYGTWVMRQGGRVTITGNTKAKIITSDARRLEETLTQDVVRVLQRWNYPGTLQHFTCRFKYKIDKPNAAEALQAANTIYQMGGSVIENEVLDFAGLGQPQQGDKVLNRAQQEQEAQQRQMQMQQEQQQQQMAMQQAQQEVAMQQQAQAEGQGAEGQEGEQAPEDHPDAVDAGRWAEMEQQPQGEQPQEQPQAEAQPAEQPQVEAQAQQFERERYEAMQYHLSHQIAEEARRRAEAPAEPAPVAIQPAVDPGIGELTRTVDRLLRKQSRVAADAAEAAILASKPTEQAVAQLTSTVGELIRAQEQFGKVNVPVTFQQPKARAMRTRVTERDPETGEIVETIQEPIGDEPEPPAPPPDTTLADRLAQVESQLGQRVTVPVTVIQQPPTATRTRREPDGSTITEPMTDAETQPDAPPDA